MFAWQVTEKTHVRTWKGKRMVTVCGRVVNSEEIGTVGSIRQTTRDRGGGVHGCVIIINGDVMWLLRR